MNRINFEQWVYFILGTIPGKFSLKSINVDEYHTKIRVVDTINENIIVFTLEGPTQSTDIWMELVRRLACEDSISSD